MLKLQFKDQRQPAIWLVEARMTIGSGAKNHIVINESGIDELHAHISREGDNLYLSDSGSFGGTFVNGNRIGQHYQLRPGDSIRIGKVELDIIDPKTGTERPAAATPRIDWSLMAITGELKGKSIPIHGSLVFGRSSSCDIVINDAHMSRRHAEVTLKDGTLRLVDLKSSNGTCVNGKQVGEQLLKPGDKISFDQVSFLVAGPAQATAAAPPEDDEDEATVFRAASIPRRPQAAVAKPVVPPPSAQVEAKVSAAPAAGNKMPLVIGVAVIVLVVVAGALALLR